MVPVIAPGFAWDCADPHDNKAARYTISQRSDTLSDGGQSWCMGFEAAGKIDDNKRPVHRLGGRLIDA